MQKVKLWISAFPGVDVLMMSTSLLFWWHTIPISNCQVVPGRRLHNHSVILERPCMFLSNGASWPELFLGIRFTTTLDPLVIGASISFSLKQVQDSVIKKSSCDTFIALWLSCWLLELAKKTAISLGIIALLLAHPTQKSRPFSTLKYTIITSGNCFPCWKLRAHIGMFPQHSWW